MVEFPKQKREIDKKYLEYIKTLPCVVANSECFGSIVPHHTVSVGAGGSDYLAIPLCAQHHIPGVHAVGKDTFQDKYHIDFGERIIKCLIGYIKKEG